MPGDRRAYQVSKASPIGRGGCATVYRAVYKPAAQIVAFKESFADDYARRRMAREIKIQGILKHAHVMPVLDADSKGKWFTMPLADGDLRLLPPRGHSEIVAMTTEVSLGLQAAHEAGHVHRDVTPGNILRITEGKASRHVVADWGLVRQPHGKTTALLTSETRFIGTQGFAAPEMYVEPHSAGITADIYSLGRVVAWLVTGTQPVTTQPLLPEGPWRHFVRRMTEPDPRARPQSMTEVRELLATVVEEQPNTAASAPDLAQRAVRGDTAASRALVQLGLDEPRNSELFLDYITAVDTEFLVRGSEAHAGALLASMAYHLSHDWGHRSFDDANPSMSWILQLAQAAASANRQGLLEDAARALFEAEAHWKRFDQRRRTRGWLLSLRGVSAQTVARALRTHPAAMEWYEEENWSSTSADIAIREAFKAVRSR
ncbi:protein kinase domain-containing protein [Sorangium sp. So ce124]|uniref:protein kinase domain-containing protein n=1 Tax=Sorangium sp. So ce124 TaxID=3133280 RepID=UPI003F627522